MTPLTPEQLRVKERFPYGAWWRGWRVNGKPAYFRAVALDVTTGPFMNESTPGPADRYHPLDDLLSDAAFCTEYGKGEDE